MWRDFCPLLTRLSKLLRALLFLVTMISFSSLGLLICILPIFYNHWSRLTFYSSQFSLTNLSGHIDLIMNQVLGDQSPR